MVRWGVITAGVAVFMFMSCLFPPDASPDKRAGRGGGSERLGSIKLFARCPFDSFGGSWGGSTRSAGGVSPPVPVPVPVSEFNAAT